MNLTCFRRIYVPFVGTICFIIYIYGRTLFTENKMNVHSKSLQYRTRLFDVSLHSNLSLSKQTPKRRVHDVNCAAIFNGDQAEIDRANELTEKGKYSREFIKDQEYVLLTRNCNNFRRDRGYDSYLQSEEESNFPIAYSIRLYKDVEQVERLLRAVYAPQNNYCLHVDADSKQEVHDAIQGIADCFDNVFVVTRKEYVVYAGFTRLQADLNCMENLLQRGHDWKYFINLPSQEFPLKTNKEIVKILTIYNGANDIPGLTGNRRVESRFANRYFYRHVDNKMKPKLIRSNQTKEDPPYNMSVVKGSAYGVFSRDFVHFVIYSEVARVVLDWFRDVYSPDEYYWATLNYNKHLGAPGSYYNDKPDKKPRVGVYALWSWEGQCKGKFVRAVCVFGVGDLQSLTTKKHLFANKFYFNYQPYALDCMEEWHFNKTVEGDLKTLNITYYESLPFIKPSNTSFKK